MLLGLNSALLEQKLVVSDEQFNSRNKLGTIEQCHLGISYIGEAIGNENCYSGVFLDVGNAFDKSVTSLANFQA